MDPGALRGWVVGRAAPWLGGRTRDAGIVGWSGACRRPEFVAAVNGVTVVSHNDFHMKIFTYRIHTSNPHIESSYRVHIYEYAIHVNINIVIEHSMIKNKIRKILAYLHVHKITISSPE